ncbi:hypothetical protein IH740_32765, partial [Escherichia coli]|nr:hypothetical protein [Escherichia coli]
HGDVQELLHADGEDDGVRHADDDELQRHADDVLHLLIRRRMEKARPG